MNPTLSAWTYLFGNHNINQVPLTPLGTKVVIHNTPDKRVTWDFHGDKGFYIGPSHNYYRFI